jgi:hypothetical protein
MLYPVVLLSSKANIDNLGVNISSKQKYQSTNNSYSNNKPTSSDDNNTTSYKRTTFEESFDTSDMSIGELFHLVKEPLNSARSNIKKMKTGEIKVIEMDDNAGCILVIKQDIEADDYYLEEMDMTVRHLLKDAEYTEKMDKEAKKLEAEINKYAVNQFKVKKIVEPDYGY